LGCFCCFRKTPQKKTIAQQAKNCPIWSPCILQSTTYLSFFVLGPFNLTSRIVRSELAQITWSNSAMCLICKCHFDSTKLFLSVFLRNMPRETFSIPVMWRFRLYFEYFFPFFVRNLTDYVCTQFLPCVNINILIYKCLVMYICIWSLRYKATFLTWR
jgi:hypothetical protein